MARAGTFGLVLLAVALCAIAMPALAASPRNSPASGKGSRSAAATESTPLTPAPPVSDMPLAEELEPDLEELAKAVSTAVSQLFAGAVPPLADMISIVAVRFIMNLLLSLR